jgi:hypothetical protein
LAWTRFHNQSLIEKFTPTNFCPYNCRFTDDRSLDKKARVRIFHAGDFSPNDLPEKRENTLNVFFSLRPPMDVEFEWLRLENFTLHNDFFNLTTGYRQDSTIQYPYGIFEPRDGWETIEEVYADEQVWFFKNFEKILCKILF